jgi:phosphoribosylformylglycinamidine synthase
MRIGMGGGAASSMATGANAAELDFDSVQRGIMNPRSSGARRKSSTICWAEGERNPDPGNPRRGRGRLSNAIRN